MSLIDRFMLTGKTGVVTGGAGGIGRAVALAFAEMGANVALLDLVDPSATAAEVQKLGKRSVSISIDVAQEEGVVEAFARIEEELSSVDILFNCAGIVTVAPAEEMSYDQWKRVVDVDLNAQFLVAREAGRTMIRGERGGSIINVASMSGHIVNWPQRQSAYNAAKAGLIHLTKSLAVEWAQYGIRVNSISPGYVATPMTLPAFRELGETWFSMAPFRRLCRPDELTGAAVYLASEAASYVTGSDIIIDGGFTLV